MSCAKCNGEAKGFKCAICKVESAEHDVSHCHGVPPSDRHCMPKCVACNEAEVQCVC